MLSRTIAGLAVLLMLGGCSFADLFGTSQALVDIVDENGKVIGKITDIALARDYAYLNRGNTRDKYDAKMYEKSGVTMKYARVDLGNGSFAWLPEQVEVRAPHAWQQQIAVQPPDHRGWKTFDNIVDKAWYAFGGWLVADTYKQALNTPTTRYQGDYLMNSYNPSTITYEPLPTSP